MGSWEILFRLLPRQVSKEIQTEGVLKVRYSIEYNNYLSGFYTFGNLDGVRLFCYIRDNYLQSFHYNSPNVEKEYEILRRLGMKEQ